VGWSSVTATADGGTAGAPLLPLLLAAPLLAPEDAPLDPLEAVPPPLEPPPLLPLEELLLLEAVAPPPLEPLEPVAPLVPVPSDPPVPVPPAPVEWGCHWPVGRLSCPPHPDISDARPLRARAGSNVRRAVRMTSRGCKGRSSPAVRVVGSKTR
jgi:hypothetical protein